MDGRFALLTGFCSIGVFAGTWALLSSRPPSPAAAAKPIVAQPVYYARCSEAWVAGAVPIYRGQPGYRPELDGDDDGITCEPHHGSGSYGPQGSGRPFRL